MKLKRQRPIDMPVMPEKCKTCPFRDNGCLELRSQIEQRVLNSASQTCHSTGLAIGKRFDTHLCRGARDFQLQIFHRLGVIQEATYEAWNETARKVGSLT